MRIINPYKMFQGAFIPNALMEWRGLSQSAKLMWARLAQYAGKDGKCYPKIETLGEEIGISRVQAKRVIKELQDSSLILVKHASGKARLMHKTSEYYFLDHPVFRGGVFDTSGGIKNDPSGRVENDPSLEGSKMIRPIEENQLRESNEDISMSGQSPDEDDEKKKRFHGSVEDHALARRIYEAVLVVNQTVKEPSWDRWANEIRLMREQDDRTREDIWHVFLYANRDQFWCNNILSPGKLRKQYSLLAPRAGVLPARIPDASCDSTGQGNEKKCGDCQWLGGGKWFCRAKGDIDGVACEHFTGRENI